MFVNGNIVRVFPHLYLVANCLMWQTNVHHSTLSLHTTSLGLFKVVPNHMYHQTLKVTTILIFAHFYVHFISLHQTLLYFKGGQHVLYFLILTFNQTQKTSSWLDLGKFSTNISKICSIIGNSLNNNKVIHIC